MSPTLIALVLAARASSDPVVVSVESSVDHGGALQTRLQRDTANMLSLLQPPGAAVGAWSIDVRGEPLAFSVTISRGARAERFDCACTRAELHTQTLQRVARLSLGARPASAAGPVSPPCPGGTVEAGRATADRLPARPEPVCERPAPPAPVVRPSVPERAPAPPHRVTRASIGARVLIASGAGLAGLGAGVWLGHRVSHSELVRQPNVRPYAAAAVASGVAMVIAGVVTEAVVRRRGRGAAVERFP